MSDIDENIQTRLLREGNVVLKELYQQYEQEFLQFACRYTQDLDLRYDALQEGMIGFYEYCIEGKYDPVKSSVKTTIFNMAKYYLFNRLKSEKKSILSEEITLTRRMKEKMVEIERPQTTEFQDRIKEALKLLGDSCRQLLILFYYKNFSVDAIRYTMNYHNENVVSSHKSRCLKQLKALLDKKE